jgi:hypothetical protein
VSYPEGYKFVGQDVVTSGNQDQFIEPVWQSRCPRLFQLAQPVGARVSGEEFHPPVGWKVQEYQKGDDFISFWETLDSIDLPTGGHWDMDYCSGVSLVDSSKVVYKPGVIIERKQAGFGTLLLAAGLGYLAWRIYKGK